MEVKMEMQNNDRGKLMKKIKYERITLEMKDERKRKTRKKKTYKLI